MLFKYILFAALLPLNLASPVPSRTVARGNATSDSLAALETILTEAANGASSDKLLSDAEAAATSLLKGSLSSALSSFLSGGGLKEKRNAAASDPSSIDEILKREAAPQTPATSTTSTPASGSSSGGLLGSLLSPVTSTVSSLLGGILRRSPSVERRALLDSLSSVTTGLGTEVGTLTKGLLGTVL